MHGSPEHLGAVEQEFPCQGYIEQTEFRAISPQQLLKVVEFASRWCEQWHDRSPPDRSRTSGERLSMETLNLYMLNDWLIRPATEARNCALVECLAGQDQVPSWFVSHWWGERIADFVDCVTGHACLRGLSKTAAFYWVCAYANRQHSLAQEVTADPRETSFYKALQWARVNGGVLAVLDEQTEHTGPATAFTRIWCVFEEAVAMGIVAGDDDEAERMLLDIGISHAGDSKFITDGLVAAEVKMEQLQEGKGFIAKSAREESFPIDLIRYGVGLRLEAAEASVASDKQHILNCVCGHPLDGEPPANHFNYSQLNQRLRSIFALAGWRKAATLGIVQELGLQRVLLEDSSRAAVELDLYDCKTIGDADLATFAAGIPPQLKELSINMTRTSVGNEGLASLAQSLPLHLEKLRLGYYFCKASDPGFASIFRQVPDSLRSLRLLLKYSTTFGDAGLASLSLALPRLPQLAELEVQCGNGMSGTVTDAGLVALGLGLRECPSITEIGLDFQSSWEITGSGWAALSPHLPRGLRRFKLFVELGMKKALCKPTFAAVVQGLPWGLEDLDLQLQGAACDDAAFALLGATLGSMSSLRRFRLGLTKTRAMSDAGLAALANGLSSSAPVLQSLDFRFFMQGVMHGGGLAALATALERATALEEFGLHLDDLGRHWKEGLAALAQALPPSLRRLSLRIVADGNHDSGLAALVASLPVELTELCLTFWGGFDDGAGVSSAGLAFMAQQQLPPTLVKFTLDVLRNRCIDDGGLAAIGQSLPEALTSFDLNLSQNNIGDAGLAAFARSLPGSLRSCSVRNSKGNSFSEEVDRVLTMTKAGMSLDDLREWVNSRPMDSDATVDPALASTVQPASSMPAAEPAAPEEIEAMPPATESALPVVEPDAPALQETDAAPLEEAESGE